MDARHNFDVHVAGKLSTAGTKLRNLYNGLFLMCGLSTYSELFLGETCSPSTFFFAFWLVLAACVEHKKGGTYILP